MTKTRLAAVLSALLLSGTVALAQLELPLDAAAGAKVSTTVAASATVRAIQTTSFDTREELLMSLESRFQAAETILAGLRLTDAAKDDVKKAGATLSDGIRKSRGATAADWESIRTDLADRYSAYAQAAIRAEGSAAPAK